ncbi:MAG: leucyl/phenylalanyl-tRNA--protein transferase [Gammaproteobacteria bacterium SHHR-1]|uniref:leucyl/phenylalanyl-tRNA--protein transferase n=1 Tax=Magnetovirga frankeli TaxID=947516 RepID=UPI001292F7DC|nr:leucyl/phenylalanyl-tRNA--protein transferase [gamma proteobacterium SS-5]
MIALLDPLRHQAFPDPEQAATEPDGLLALGGDLSPERLLAAYRRGIFPWYNEGQPILWWSPNPRTLLYPARLHLSRSLKKRLRRCDYRIAFDTDFAAVIDACAAPRRQDSGTWITQDMRDAYLRLHRLGHAHSVEVWQEGELVGGLYGIGIKRAFFGESMFSRVDDGSKIALAGLVHGFAAQLDLIDCQVRNAHLISLGAQELERQEFGRQLAIACAAASGPEFAGVGFSAQAILAGPPCSTRSPKAAP